MRRQDVPSVALRPVNRPEGGGHRPGKRGQKEKNTCPGSLATTTTTTTTMTTTTTVLLLLQLQQQQQQLSPLYDLSAARRDFLSLQAEQIYEKKNLRHSCGCPNDTFRYTLEAEFVTLVKSKSPVGSPSQNKVYQ